MHKKKCKNRNTNMKETCYNGVNKVHKNWKNFDVKHSNILIKTVTKNVINVFVYALQNALQMSTKANIQF